MQRRTILSTRKRPSPLSITSMPRSVSSPKATEALPLRGLIPILSLPFIDGFPTTVGDRYAINWIWRKRVKGNRLSNMASRFLAGLRSLGAAVSRHYFLFALGGLTVASPSKTIVPSWFTHEVLNRTRFLSAIISVTSTRAVMVSPMRTGARKFNSCLV